MDEIDVSDIIDKYIKRATSASDLLRWLIICKYALEKAIELGVEDSWVREAFLDIIGDLAKLILSLRSILNR